MGQGHGAAAGGGHTERGTFRPHSAASKAEKRRHILAQVVPDRTSANVEELRGEFDPEVGTSRDHARRPPSSRSRPGSSSRRSRVAPSPTLEQQPALPHSTSNNVEVVRNEGMNREEGSSEHMSEDLSRMAKYLGLDMLRDQAYMWIAEEALFADLPADWEEYRDSGDHVYYYNAKSGQTTWNHPLDPYYKFLTAKLKKMHANGRKKMVSCYRATMEGGYSGCCCWHGLSDVLLASVPYSYLSFFVRVLKTWRKIADWSTFSG
mmetsp:Transcript_47086/g.121641  ORF Transcript_47086/g.121641 Transcript_47086/m.121641 type:complete len:263 (-) Transcript_47086:2135-2923(-)